MLKNLVQESRSIRSFQPGAGITKEGLLSLIDTARNCPATMNLQVLKYRPVTTPEECRKVLALTRWATSLSQKLPPRGHEPTAYIVICHDTAIAPEKEIFLIDVGIAAQTIMLAAKEAGFGGCIIGSAAEKEVHDTLQLSENIVPKLILALGIPDEAPILTEAKNREICYYRDTENRHYVPKRPLEEILIKPYFSFE